METFQKVSGSYSGGRLRANVRMDEVNNINLSEIVDGEKHYTENVRGFCWTKTRLLSLIELYTSKPELWLFKHPHYYDKRTKYYAWKEISKVVGCSPFYCHKKMNELIKSYRKNWAIIKRNKGNIVASHLTVEVLKKLRFIINQEKSNYVSSSKGRNSSIYNTLRFPVETPEEFNAPAKESICLNFAAFIASKLKLYSDHTRNIVEREITDIIFKADQGCFQPNMIPSRST